MAREKDALSPLAAGPIPRQDALRHHPLLPDAPSAGPLATPTPLLREGPAYNEPALPSPAPAPCPESPAFIDMLSLGIADPVAAGGAAFSVTVEATLADDGALLPYRLRTLLTRSRPWWTLTGCAERPPPRRSSALWLRTVASLRRSTTVLCQGVLNCLAAGLSFTASETSKARSPPPKPASLPRVSLSVLAWTSTKPSPQLPSSSPSGPLSPLQRARARRPT